MKNKNEYTSFIMLRLYRERSVDERNNSINDRFPNNPKKGLS